MAAAEENARKIKQLHFGVGICRIYFIAVK
jgi:hypothetical protein